MADRAPASLLEWLDACPTPFHVAQRAAAVLGGAGFSPVERLDGTIPSRGILVREGSVVAWALAPGAGTFRIVGAHTDSPNLRLQPRPDSFTAGWAQLGIEIYGGVLLNSWLDRDLGLAGRVITGSGETVLFDSRRPIARVPQLAIHLDREVNERGLVLDRHAHTVPVWASSKQDFAGWLAEETGCTEIAAFDAHLYDTTPAAVIGADSSLIASGRLDNQLSCWAAVSALARTAPSLHHGIVVLNDHEEVGSASTTGADGPLLESVIDTICEGTGMSRAARHEAMARSWCLSADNAHAVHPNYRERHDPAHAPVVNGGPALKSNANQRYATSAAGAALARQLAGSAGVPLQEFVSRNNIPCGSTIGPLTATRLGVPSIDVGVPQLSMHSAREMCGADDPARLETLVAEFLG